MFENTRFLSCQIKKPVTPTAISYGFSSFPEQNTFHNKAIVRRNLPDNMKNADFFITGRMDVFLRPPVKDFALQNLYHMEAFSIFYCDKNFFTKRKDYNSYLILYTYEGGGLLEYEEKTYHLSAGDGFFIDCRQPHRYQTEGSCWKHSVFHLNGPLMSSVFNEYMQTGSAVFSQPITGNYQTGLERLLTVYSTAQPHRDWLASDCISHILTDLLLTSYSEHANSSVPENLRYLIKYMENNFSSVLSLDFLSRFSGISKYYLSREFKKYTGFSPTDYLILLRVEHAKSLLRSTTLPANKIAHIAGIHDINNFNNLFKKKTGMTPGQYRKKSGR